MREVKDSGVDWIGVIPIDWTIVRGKSISNFINGYAFDSRNLTSNYHYPVIRIGDIKNGEVDFDNCIGVNNNSGLDFYRIKKNDVVIAMSGATVGKIGYIKEDKEAYINQRVGIIRSDISKYIYYSLSTENFLKYIMFMNNSSAQPNISSSTYGNYYFTMPINRNVNKIVCYLDEKCSKIESIIEKQQKIIEKLKEYKLSILDEITNGIQGARCNLGKIASFKNGINYSDNIEGKSIRFLGVGNFKDFFVLDDINMFSSIYLKDDISQDYMLKNGDIVFVRSNGSKELVGRAVMVNNVDYPLTYSGFCIRFRNNRKDIVDDEFILFYFRSSKFRKEIEKNSQGSNINNLNQELLSHISFVIPDLQYQKKMVVKLKRKTVWIDKVIANKTKLIKKFEEYKKSLIYEVVTGKKEVADL